MPPTPLLFSEPMPNEKKHENGEGGEDGEKKDTVENPWYDPGFENLGEGEEKSGDELVDQTAHQDDVVTKNFFEQSPHGLSIASQRQTIEAKHDEYDIIQAGRDDDPSVADAIKSVGSEEGDPIAKTQAFDSLATRKAMYTSVLGDQVERGHASNEEEAARASSELGSIIEAGASALNNASTPETTEAILAKEHLKHTLDEAAEIKAETDAKLSAEPTPNEGEMEYEAVDAADEDAETSGAEDVETPATPEVSPEGPETPPTPNIPTEQELEPNQADREPIPVFIHYDDQMDYDHQQAIYDAMASQHPDKKPEDGETS